jgi:curved DNA-binding protein CbpA
MRESPGFDPYAILGVGRDADAVIIQLAYRARIRAVHPDVAGAAGLEQAKRLNLARDWLLEADRRARLDAPTGMPSSGPPADRYDGARGWKGSAQRRWQGSAQRRRDRRWRADPGPGRRPGLDPATDDLGPRTRELRRFLEAIEDLTPDERARVNYSLGEMRPPSFDAYEDFLEPMYRSRSHALREAVARAWERGVDEPAPYVHPLGRIVPSGFLVANAYAQWILLADVLRDELDDAMSRSEHVYETLAARCRQPWEGSVGQARYGPYGPHVLAVLRTATVFPVDAAERLARSWHAHLGRDARDQPSDRVGPGIWLPSPPGYPPSLTVSGYLAAVDASRITPPAGTARRLHDGYRYGLRLTAHVLALGLGGRAASDYLRPWRDAVGLTGVAATG